MPSVFIFISLRVLYCLIVNNPLFISRGDDVRQNFPAGIRFLFADLPILVSIMVAISRSVKFNMSRSKMSAKRCSFKKISISGLDAASAGFRVGYEDPTYFSRDYKNLFGAPPQRDIARMRSNLEI
jgi:AraC-like DNA-binding protein